MSIVAKVAVAYGVVGAGLFAYSEYDFSRRVKVNPSDAVVKAHDPVSTLVSCAAWPLIFVAGAAYIAGVAVTGKT